MNAPEPPLMTAKEVAEWLRVSVDDVYRRAARGELPSLMIGNRRRFRRADVQAYVDEQVARTARAAEALAEAANMTIAARQQRLRDDRR